MRNRRSKHKQTPLQNRRPRSKQTQLLHGKRSPLYRKKIMQPQIRQILRIRQIMQRRRIHKLLRKPAPQPKRKLQKKHKRNYRLKSAKRMRSYSRGKKPLQTVILHKLKALLTRRQRRCRRVIPPLRPKNTAKWRSLCRRFQKTRPIRLKR